ncbi:TetR family transcriptional regulator [Bacillus aerolatus]|uniref:TetR family transcriptional regulator n=1 Tax=Bacillus aerolatus TaxID=2653354 RepID=A0A6I1FGE2_9BACI|nr:TetR/AcrR family transcriptional regulator [Bacillus aerolatus]KAB7707243.1 TetR family transcriptional regulator [Bacillus aerolatus]
MYAAFERQPQAKKELILQVAIEEFVKNGYDKTSTDIITSRAGISKGLLFHYFKSKKNLYIYLVKCTVTLLTEKTMEAINNVQSGDFFERVKEIARLKHEAMAPYRQETQFITDAFFYPPAAVRIEIEEMMEKHYEAYGEDYLQRRIYMKELIPPEKLRPGISADTVIQMTAFIVEQLSAKYQTLYKNKQYDFFNDPDPLMKELEDYLDIVKHGVYEKE